MVELECQRWASKGVNIVYQIRETRGGYKAGALKEGLKRSYVKHCEYVAIFDADFRPEPDFLRRAIPFLVHNSDIALVQARWRFGNFLYLLFFFLFFIHTIVLGHLIFIKLYQMCRYLIFSVTCEYDTFHRNFFLLIIYGFFFSSHITLSLFV